MMKQLEYVELWSNKSDIKQVWDLNTLQCHHTLKTKDKVEALLATPQALVSVSGDYLEVFVCFFSVLLIS